MLRYSAVVCIVICAALASMYFWIGVPRISHFAPPEFAAPHFYGNPGRSIEKIQISAFYFVPENKAVALAADWAEVLQTGLQKLVEFHSLQFQGRSSLSFKMYPKPVIGLRDNQWYDTEITQRGNPRALIAIGQELEARAFHTQGDLFLPDFVALADNAYPVLFVMYEGVGASGGVIYESELESVSEIAQKLGLPESVIFKVDIKSVDGFFLVNREFLAGSHGPAGTSVFAHEFYHTIGVPDGYDEETAVAREPDIMGLGRTKPLDKTYVSKETLKSLGL